LRINIILEKKKKLENNHQIQTQDSNIDNYYELFGVVEHIGCSNDYGHYMTKIRLKVFEKKTH